MPSSLLAWSVVALLARTVEPGASLDSAAKLRQADTVDVEPVAGGDAMSFEDEPPGEEPGPGGEAMTFETGGTAVPMVRAVEAPRPANESLSVPEPLEVRVTARRVVAEQIRIVPIEIRAPTQVRTLRGVTTLGEMHGPDRVEPGLFEADVRLPALHGPAVILALFEGEGCAGYVRITVWKAANLEVETEPGAQVQVEIAGQTFGPVRAQGRTATVPVEIPPGAEKARVVARDAAGNESTQNIDLPHQRYPLALVVPPAASILADDTQVLPILAAVTETDGGLPAEWSVSVESGALGEPADIATGLRIYPWRPSRALGEQGIVVTQEDGETRTPVEMTAGPPVGVEIQAEPDILPADGLSTSTIYAGVSDGLGHYLESGTIEVDIAGGIILQAPQQTGPVVLASVVADRMLPGGEPPAAIVVSARAGGYEGVVAIRQFDPDARGLRLTPAATRLAADGESRTEVRVELLDGLGDPLPVTDQADVSVIGGSAPSTIGLVDGVATVPLVAGTASGMATVRVALAGAVAIATVALDPGPADHLRLDISPDPGRGANVWSVRARLEDRFGNGVPGEDTPAFQASTTRGSLGPFADVEAADVAEVGWREAALTLAPDESRAAEVTVAAGEWSASAWTTSNAELGLYLALGSGYLHNLGSAGVVPVRLGLGWNGAFGLRGFLLGLELEYRGLRTETTPERNVTYGAAGDMLATCAVLGYRWAATSWLAILGQVALGMQVGWFRVDRPGAEPDESSDGVVAFAVGVRLGVGFAVGPGLILLDLSYDDARYDDIVYGNVGGLGALLGYRLEL
ncbi:MAG: hypothetical protein HY905_16310 [Deltaproteobacteria bacterium]|nr:hypothetical protein [Deltaproteobacteria bacterium]